MTWFDLIAELAPHLGDAADVQDFDFDVEIVLPDGTSLVSFDCVRVERSIYRNPRIVLEANPG